MTTTTTRRTTQTTATPTTATTATVVGATAAAATATPTTVTPPAAPKKPARAPRAPKTVAAAATPSVAQALRVTCARDALKEGLALVSRAIASRSTLPVLNNVLLTAGGPDRLRLVATDLQLGITTDVAATVEGDGAVTIPARLLTDLVATLPNELVTLMLDDPTQTLQIRCGRSEATIKGIAAEDFPSLLTGVLAEPAVTLDAATLRDAIMEVAFAAATDEARPVLQGVLCDLTHAQLRLSASDGFRLAIKTVTLAAPVPSRRLLIPARALMELSRILPATDAPVTLAVTPNGGQVVVRSGPTEVMSRLIDGTFPDLQRVIPTAYGTRAVVERQALQRATRQAAVFATASGKITRLTLAPGVDETRGRLTVAATTAEVGDNQTAITAHVTGVEGQIAFNNTFLHEALQAIPLREVAIEVQTPATPGVLRPVGDDSLLIIIMPLAIH